MEQKTIVMATDSDYDKQCQRLLELNEPFDLVVMSNFSNYRRVLKFFRTVNDERITAGSAFRSIIDPFYIGEIISLWAKADDRYVIEKEEKQDRFVVKFRPKSQLA